MTPESLEYAIACAEEFIRRAKLVPITTLKYDPAFRPELQVREYRRLESPCKHAASVKRASMDLTRALAEMRKP